MMARTPEDKTTARERILTIAEDLLLEDGYDNVSIRELTDAAGVNVALVNYYFGSKRNLYLEALRSKFSCAAKRKCALLHQSINANPDPDLRQIISAYVALHMSDDECVAATQSFLQLVSRQLAEDDDAMELLLQEMVTPIHQLLKNAIGKIYPKMPEAKISYCISSITGQIFHFLRCPGAFRTLAGHSETDDLRELVAEHIIEFSLKGIMEETVCDFIP